MPFISEVSSIFIQRFYTGWITLRNQLATPIRLMGRRVIELYDALISGNDWEITPFLSLKRRAGHTAYVLPNFAAQFFYSWKSNTQGTIPIIDTTGDIEYVNSSGTATVITTKTSGVQSSILGIGNYLYVGNTATTPFKWDGPTGSQGKTNWGIANTNTGGTFGPQTAGTGANQAIGGNVAWVNPNNVTGSGSYATVTLTAPSPTQISEGLFATNFNFSSLSIPATNSIIGIVVKCNAYGTALSELGISIVKGGSLTGTGKGQIMGTSPALVTLGTNVDLWGGSFTVNDVNQVNFGVAFFASNYVGNPTVFNVNNVTMTIYTNNSVTPTPTGSGSFSAVNGYTYVVSYGNAVSGEISNSTPPSINTGPFTNKAYVGIPVTASPDAQVNQIRVYRTTDSGGGNQFFEISNSPFTNTTATIQDTTADTALQVTSQAEINLGNTPPPATITNLCWFAGRMWGSTNNLLYASTGPETISGSAPNSNWNPLFQWVIPQPLVRNIRGPNGMLVFTIDDCYIVRGTDIVNYTVNEFVKDFGIRTYNACDTDGTNLYVFTSDRQFIQVTSSGAQDIGLPIADQLLTVDPTQVYVSVNRYGLDSIVRILDTVNNVYYDFNLNQQCWNLPGILKMPGCTAMGSIETAPGVWRPLVSSTNITPQTTLAYRDITKFQDLGANYSPVAVFGSIQLADPGQLAKFGARGGFCLEMTSAGKIPTLAVLPNDIGCTLSNPVGSQVTGPFTSLSVGKNPVAGPPTLGNDPVNYRSLVYYYLLGKGLSGFVRHLQFQIIAPPENAATELIGFGIFGDEKQESSAPGALPQLQGK